MILVFSFLTGNPDMYLKNFSLIKTKEGSGQYIFSPAYDLLPVSVLIPEDMKAALAELIPRRSAALG